MEAEPTARFEADLLVVGAGMAGMTAGARAAQRGLRAVVVERAPQHGGSAALSGGFIWKINSAGEYLDHVPEGDATLARVQQERYQEGLDWIGSLGVHVGQGMSPHAMPYMSGHLVDILGYLERCRRLILDQDGAIITSATVESLVSDGNAVIGGLVVDRDGVTHVDAPFTVLATGGFQANPELVREYLGDAVARILVRSNRYSCGDGLWLGRSVGGALTDGAHAFYGHVMAYPIAKEFLPGDYLRLAQSMYSGYGVLLDQAGHRFTDESLGYFIERDAGRAPGDRARASCRRRPHPRALRLATANRGHGGDRPATRSGERRRPRRLRRQPRRARRPGGRVGVRRGGQ